MTYTLPDLLRNATANGSITSGSTTVGTITVANNTVTLAFDTTWLAKQKTETNTVISGDFLWKQKLTCRRSAKMEPVKLSLAIQRSTSILLVTLSPSTEMWI